ncbi:tumor protein p53-inducible protein 11-like isoform X3 [Cetorhinus maximus]
MAAKQQPPLIKKHSQSDLVSRLKTRKILGVGGKDDDGEIHRSKISQVLGNEMKFAMREPLGLRIWQLMSAIMFSLVAIIKCVSRFQALTFPKLLYEAVFEEEASNSTMSVRLYGGALLSISVIMWHALYTAEKSIIQWTLLTEAFYFTVQFLVTTVPLFEKGALPQGVILLQLSRGLFILISVYFYYQVGRKPKKV